MKVIVYGKLLGEVVGSWKGGKAYEVLISGGPKRDGQTWPWHGPVDKQHLTPLTGIAKVQSPEK